MSALSHVSGSVGAHTDEAGFWVGRSLPAQRAVIDRVRKACATRLPPDSAGGEEAALAALLRSGSRYDAGPETGGLAQYGQGEVSLLARQGTPIDIRDMIDGEAYQDVCDVAGRMLLSLEELEAEFEKGVPRVYHDPVLKNNRSHYLSFLKSLWDCGVVSFASQVKVQLGCFFVFEKNRKLRLIIDARLSNTFFRRPPSGNNSSASALAALRVPTGSVLYGSQYDGKDFFYRIGIPWEISQHFGLPSYTR